MILTYATFLNEKDKDIKEAIVAVITKSASSDTPVNSKDVQKDVTASIKTVLSSQLQGYFKANKISNETSSTNAIVKSVSSSISKQESADIAKIVCFNIFFMIFDFCISLHLLNNAIFLY